MQNNEQSNEKQNEKTIHKEVFQDAVNSLNNATTHPMSNEQKNTPTISEKCDEKQNDFNNGNQKFQQYVRQLIKSKEEPNAKGLGALILLGFMLVLFLISVTGFFVMWFTEYYNDKMLANIILKDMSDAAMNWQNPNPKYDTLLKVHIFNYTNIPEYLSGVDDKLKVKDLGPLTYKEHTTKTNVVFNENHTVTFRDHKSYEFLPEKSTFREHDMLIVPNVPLLSASFKVDKMNPFKRFGAMAIIKSFNEPVFKPLTAFDYLWGYVDRIVALDNNRNPYFGLLKNRNGTSVDSLQINTGVDDLKKYSIATQFNGKPLMDFWSTDECNRIDGSDASMFPPHLVQSKENLYVFLQVLCRRIPLHFQKEVTILDNIDALRYLTPHDVFASPDVNPANECYCRNTATCLPSGVINATKCYNDAPIFPSFPHFFTGDPIIYKDIEGIEPHDSLHQTYADIHPRFGFPIGGASRIQINIRLYRTSIISDKIKIEDGTILPLIWIEITPGDFSEDMISDLYISTFGLNAIQNTLKYGTLLTCLASFSLIVAVVYNLRSRILSLNLDDDEKNPNELEFSNTVSNRAATNSQNRDDTI